MRVPLIDPLSRASFCGIWNKERCLQLVDRFSFHFVLSAFLSSHRSKKMCLLTFPDIRVFPPWNNLAPKLHRHWCPAREETYTLTSAPASWRISSWVMCLAGSRLKFCDLASPHSLLVTMEFAARVRDEWLGTHVSKRMERRARMGIGLETQKKPNKWTEITAWERLPAEFAAAQTH